MLLQFTFQIYFIQLLDELLLFVRDKPVSLRLVPYITLHLETELPQGESGKIVIVLHAESQPVKHGSYANGQLATDGREQNTVNAVRWRS